MGLLGPSLNELAEKEKKLRASGIKMAIEKNNNFRKLTIRDIVILVSIGIILLCVFIMVGYTVYYNITKPKPNYEEFYNAVANYANTEDSITGYEFNDDIVYIYVSDVWYLAGEVDKIRFCKNIRDNITVYGMQYNIVNSNYVYTVFYDSTNIRVAEPNLTDYDILH